MEMNGERKLAVDRNTAWAALNDTAVLQRCVPGCESITETAPNQYDVVVSTAIGPIKTRFKGRLGLADIVAPASYTLRFEGQAQAGFARGEARVALEEVAAQQTLLRYTASAQVGGKLAQVGSRLIDVAAAAMADQFFAAFSEQVAGQDGAAGTAPPAKLGVWSLLLAMLRRLFKRG